MTFSIVTPIVIIVCTAFLCFKEKHRRNMRNTATITYSSQNRELAFRLRDRNGQEIFTVPDDLSNSPPVYTSLDSTSYKQSNKVSPEQPPPSYETIRSVSK